MPRGQPAVATAVIPDRLRPRRVPPCRAASGEQEQAGQVQAPDPLAGRPATPLLTWSRAPSVTLSGRASGLAIVAIIAIELTGRETLVQMRRLLSVLRKRTVGAVEGAPDPIGSVSSGAQRLLQEGPSNRSLR